MLARWILIALTLTSGIQHLDACMVIGEEAGQPVISRNFDYPLGGADGYGMILHNPQGYLRRAMRIHSEDQPLIWQSKHASITFNLFNPGTPQDGLNEAGLMGTMTVIASRFHKTHEDSTLPSINEMEFMQYILDQAHYRDEVVKLVLDYQGDLEDGMVIQDAAPKIRLTKISKLRNRDGEVNLHDDFAWPDFDRASFHQSGLIVPPIVDHVELWRLSFHRLLLPVVSMSFIN